jgi:hypothetical protein
MQVIGTIRSVLQFYKAQMYKPHTVRRASSRLEFTSALMASNAKLRIESMHFFSF